MRHVVKPRCRFECRFIQVSDNLWLCPHASFGSASYMLGAVEEARRLLERSGGYDAVLSRIVAAEDERKQERKQQREKEQQQADKALRYR